MLRPGALANALGGLSVTVEGVRCRSGVVAVADYGGPGRPASIVEVTGQGQTGFGELVSFSLDEHRSFSSRAAELLAAARGRVEELLRPEVSGHERAALEGALIDLGLRQAGASLAGLCGVAEGRLRWVASFGAMADPGSWLAPPGTTGLKIDVHPGWTEAAIVALQALPVVIFDWKGQGTVALADRVSAAFPRSIFEDPPDGCRHVPIARDRPLARGPQVREAIARGELVNLKGPRMGGFLELLRALETVPPGRAYFGGMFEIGPGREQARQLAAIFCPDAPNDLAPFPGGQASLAGPSPSAIRLDRPGFGSNLDWSRTPPA